MGTGPFDRNTGGVNLSNTILKNLFCGTSTTNTWAPTGGTSLSITIPFNLRLMGTAGSDTANGTQLSAGSGYSTGGVVMGTSSAANFTISNSVISSANAQSWTATGTWATVNGIEIWDSSGTAQRMLQSGNSTFNAITGIASGDTVTFAAAAITYDGTAW